MSELVFQVEKLLVLGIEQVLVLEGEQTELLTPGAHLNLTKLDQ